jgi:1-deoxy-D-xylulose-5-phosphate synthase
VPPLEEIPRIEYGTWETLRKGRGVAILAVGTMVLPALAAARLLEAEGLDATVVNCRFIKPFDEQTLDWVADRHHTILTVEEGTVVNGFGAALSAHLHAVQRHAGLRIDVAGVPDRLFEHADREQQLQEAGLTPDAIAARARALAADMRVAAVRETA